MGQERGLGSCADEGAGTIVTKEERRPVCVVVYDGDGGDACNPYWWVRMFVVDSTR